MKITNPTSEYVGIYDCRCNSEDDSVFYRKWDGAYWHTEEDGLQDALRKSSDHLGNMYVEQDVLGGGYLLWVCDLNGNPRSPYTTYTQLDLFE